MRMSRKIKMRIREALWNLRVIPRPRSLRVGKIGTRELLLSMPVTYVGTEKTRNFTPNIEYRRRLVQLAIRRLCVSLREYGINPAEGFITTPDVNTTIDWFKHREAGPVMGSIRKWTAFVLWEGNV